MNYGVAQMGKDKWAEAEYDFVPKKNFFIKEGFVAKVMTFDGINFDGDNMLPMMMMMMGGNNTMQGNMMLPMMMMMSGKDNDMKKLLPMLMMMGGDQNQMLPMMMMMQDSDDMSSMLPMMMMGGSQQQQQNPMMMLAISTAFAAPLLEIVGGESGGVHFTGDSSTGKTTLLIAACSVWGGESYKRSWRATAHGLEGVAAMFNDGFLAHE